ncbi:hypothetical protein TWF718_005972 [Orbilia javanica]|uniref:Uncharacterized protein n=1 Tax=Orbilia javanica TaxID=47235 RepID=A0AAN8RJH5_9PEZI
MHHPMDDHSKKKVMTQYIHYMPSLRRKIADTKPNEALSSNRILPAMPQTAVFVSRESRVTPDGGEIKPGRKYVSVRGDTFSINFPFPFTHTSLGWFRLALLTIKLHIVPLN